MLVSDFGFRISDLLQVCARNVLTYMTFVRCSLILSVGIAASAWAEDDPPAKGIQDNSFLIEEAYNQEAGVVQHIFNGLYRHIGNGEHAADLAFTQEWPLFSQRHQLSYTVPYSFMKENGEWTNGVNDVLLNYRLQALFETDQIPAFAPRLSLILPTGDADKGFGNDTVGTQLNLPVSKVISDRWTMHANLGATFYPDADDHFLDRYFVGGSVIYAATRDFNLVLECIGNFDEDLDRRGGTERTSAVVVSPGIRYAWNFPNGAQVVGGVAVPVGLTNDAADYGVFLYLSIEHSFLRPKKTEILAK